MLYSLYSWRVYLVQFYEYLVLTPYFFIRLGHLQRVGAFALRRRQEALALSAKYVVLPAIFPAFWSIAIFSRTADARLAAWYVLLGCLLFLLAYDDFAYRSILTVDLLALAGLVGVEVLVWQTPVMTSRLIMVALALVIILPVLYFYPQGFGEGDGWVIGLSAFLCGAGFYPRIFLISIILALLQGIIDSIWVGAVSCKPVPWSPGWPSVY